MSYNVAGSEFFYFQAEDGIRDLTVTGVQTCALPIFKRQVSDLLSLAVGWQGLATGRVQSQDETPVRSGTRKPVRHAAGRIQEIGRASCRGKSVDLGGRRIIKKKKRAGRLVPWS